MMAQGTSTSPPRGALWRTVKAIAWAFLGIRQNRASHEDMSRLNPIHIIAVALAGVALFVGGLVLLVHWVAGQ